MRPDSDGGKSSPFDESVCVTCFFHVVVSNEKLCGK